MKKIIFLLAFVSAALFTKIYLVSSTEDKINKAIPVSSEIKFLYDEITKQIPENKEKLFSNTYKNKLKLRALNCSEGYQPSWYESTKKVKSSLHNIACFNDTDFGLKNWLDIIKMGLILEQPPLSTAQTLSTKFILGDAAIGNVSFAQDAGIALLGLSNQLQIIDINTNKTIFKTTQDRSSIRFSTLSPNGKLFYTSDQNGLKIRSSENGALIATLSTDTQSHFSWINSRFAFYYQQSKGKPIILDFSSGKEIELNGTNGQVTQALPIKESKNQFIVTGGNKAYLFEVITNDDNASINLMSEAVANNNYFASHTSALTTGGKYLYTTLSNTLSIIPVNDFNTQTIKLEPFHIQDTTITNSPDNVIVRGYIQGNNTNLKAYVYSITDNTITPITDARATNVRFVYIPSLNKVGVIRESKIEILDNIKLGDAISLNKFISDAATEVSLIKLQQLEQQEAFRQGYDYPNTNAAVPRKVELMSKGNQVTSAYTPTLRAPAPFATLAKNAQIESIGVYESETSHKNGDVIVKVQPSSKPIILVLSSYEGVKWHIIKMPGASIAAILLSGYEQSEVVGAGSTRITNLGKVYAYEGNNRQKLDYEVFKMTGKHIDLFQGRYKGSSFSVGGM